MEPQAADLEAESGAARAKSRASDPAAAGEEEEGDSLGFGGRPREKRVKRGGGWEP